MTGAPCQSWAMRVRTAIFWYGTWVLEDAFELSSMGIRVDADTLKHQLALTGDEDRLQLEGIRRYCAVKCRRPSAAVSAACLTMLLLQLPHIGQVQCGVWPAAVRESVPSLLASTPPASEQAASHPVSCARYDRKCA